MIAQLSDICYKKIKELCCFCSHNFFSTHVSFSLFIIKIITGFCFFLCLVQKRNFLFVSFYWTCRSLLNGSKFLRASNFSSGFKQGMYKQVPQSSCFGLTTLSGTSEQKVEQWHSCLHSAINSSCNSDRELNL